MNINEKHQTALTLGSDVLHTRETATAHHIEAKVVKAV